MLVAHKFSSVFWKKCFFTATQFATQLDLSAALKKVSQSALTYKLKSLGVGGRTGDMSEIRD